jgi:hypothetical protein
MQALLTFLRIWPDKKHDFPFAMLEAQRQVLPRGVCPSYSFFGLGVGAGVQGFQGRVASELLYHVAWANMSGCGSSSWVHALGLTGIVTTKSH